MNNVAVQEVISHGDFTAIRWIEVDLDSVDAVADMLNTCSYLQLPEPDFGVGAALVSRTYEEIVTQRAKDAARVAENLAAQGVAEIGWVEYRVMQSIAIPILQLKAGWSADKIARCFK